LQLQPKLRSSQITVSVAGEENSKSRFATIKQIGAPHLQTTDADFGYAVSSIDPLSKQELLAAKPDGEIIAAAPRHFFPGQMAVKYDGAKERWSRFLRQSVKVDLMTKRMIHHEDTQTVHG
jgi:hypothetical protein